MCITKKGAWLCIVICILFIFGINYLLVFRDSFDNINTVILSTLLSGLVAILAAMLMPFITDWINQKNIVGKYQIGIQIKYLFDKMVVFSAIIENISEKEIVIKKAALFIDEGEEKNKLANKAHYYEFPSLLGHDPKDTKKYGKQSKCKLCKYCRDNEETEYPPNINERLGDKFCTSLVFEHLTKDAVTYMGISEKYLEDKVFKFSNEGVFRATFIVLDDEDKCQCITKQFYVGDKYIEKNIGHVA